MRPTKLASLALVAILTLGTCAAQAAIGTTTNYSKLNVAITIATNTAQTGNSGAWTIPTKTAKIGNKQLLDLFANWVGIDNRSANTAWSTAQLVIAWDWGNYDVLVVDKSGTNVLFDATAGAGSYPNDAYFSVNFWYNYGVGNQGYKNASSGGYFKVVDTGTAYFELLDNYAIDFYTDIWGYGGNQQTFQQNWDKNSNFSTWTDKEAAKYPNNGEQYYINGGPNVTSTATISASGKGKGQNYIGWAGR